MSNIFQKFVGQIGLFDGAMGTEIAKLNLTAENFGGEKFQNCNEILNLTAPEKIAKIHENYAAAAADILETNTFGASEIALAEFSLAKKCAEINFAAAKIARKIAEKFGGKLVAGSVGPSGKSIFFEKNPFEKIKLFDKLEKSFAAQIRGLKNGGVDFLILETFSDVLNLRAALVAARKVAQNLPIFVSLTLEKNGRLLSGQTPAAAFAVAENFAPAAVGLNCATGPAAMISPLRELKKVAGGIPTFAIPNAGLPDENGNFPQTPQKFAAEIAEILRENLVDFVGGCCGTTPAHILKLQKLRENFSGKNCGRVNPRDISGVNGEKNSPEKNHGENFTEKNRGENFFENKNCGGEISKIENAAENFTEKNSQKTCHLPLATCHLKLSGANFFELEKENSPILIGERTNAIGSKIFRNLIAENKFELAAEIGKNQENRGAQILDFCAANPDRDEFSDFLQILNFLAVKTKIPLMLDSTDSKIFENAAKILPGKGILNSANFETGEKNFKKIAAVAKKFGAALVVGAIDENGPAKTAREKLKIFDRAAKILFEKLKIPPREIIFDPLVFPLATGEKNLQNSARETFAALKILRAKNWNSVLGISNCSFGLPLAAREILNSVFFQIAAKNGLNFAIANAAKILSAREIPAAARKLAENLIFGKSKNAAENLAKFFREKNYCHPEFISGSENKKIPKRVRNDKNKISEISAEIFNQILRGRKTNLPENLEILRATKKPLEILNEILLPAMARVGELFGAGELILTEVLQSAEAMKAATDFLEKYFPKNSAQKKRTLILATVRGDVHDIGKNLAGIIFANNSWRVVDLGVKVESEKIVAAAKKFKPDLIGLSGLLVKSCEQMIAVAADLKSAKIRAPLLLGGAALSANFVREKVAPKFPAFFAPDAMAGLKIAGEICEK